MDLIIVIIILIKIVDVTIIASSKRGSFEQRFHTNGMSDIVVIKITIVRLISSWIMLVIWSFKFIISYLSQPLDRLNLVVWMSSFHLLIAQLNWFVFLIFICWVGGGNPCGAADFCIGGPCSQKKLAKPDFFLKDPQYMYTDGQNANNRAKHGQKPSKNLFFPAPPAVYMGSAWKVA